jgi:hypothetical protein
VVNYWGGNLQESKGDKHGDERHGGTRDMFTISNPATLAKSYWKVVHRHVCLLSTRGWSINLEGIWRRVLNI